MIHTELKVFSKSRAIKTPLCLFSFTSGHSICNIYNNLIGLLWDWNPSCSSCISLKFLKKLLSLAFGNLSAIFPIKLENIGRTIDGACRLLYRDCSGTCRLNSSTASDFHLEFGLHCEERLLRIVSCGIHHFGAKVVVIERLSRCFNKTHDIFHFFEGEVAVEPPVLFQLASLGM